MVDHRHLKTHFDTPGSAKVESLNQLAFGMNKKKAACLFYQTCGIQLHLIVLFLQLLHQSLHYQCYRNNVSELCDSSCYKRLHKSRTKGTIWRHTNFQRCKDVKIAVRVEADVFIYREVKVYYISLDLGIALLIQVSPFFVSSLNVVCPLFLCSCQISLLKTT